MLMRLLLIVFVAALVSCGTVPVSNTGQTQANVNYAQAWINGLQASAPAVVQTTATVCQNNMSKECAYANLAAGLLPFVISGAQAAVQAYQNTPTADTKKALDTAMAPVYKAAVQVNTP